MFSAIEIIAAGKIKKGPLLDLWDEYAKRMSSRVKLHEIPESDPAQFEKMILKKLSDQSIIIALDEKGKDLPSVKLSQTLQNYTNKDCKPMQFCKHICLNRRCDGTVLTFSVVRMPLGNGFGSI